MHTPSIPEEQEPEPRRYGRRLFLVTLAGGISSLYWGKAAWDHVTGVVSPVANAIAPILPSGGWRIYTISGHMPVFDPKTWRLKIGGHVEHPVSLTYDELRALPRVEQVSTFHCVTGWTVENVRWGGVRIHDVLAAAKPQSTAPALEFVSMGVPSLAPPGPRLRSRGPAARVFLSPPPGGFPFPPPASRSSSRGGKRSNTSTSGESSPGCARLPPSSCSADAACWPPRASSTPS